MLKPAGQVNPVKDGPDDAKTIAALRLEAGDVIDVAVLPPMGSGAVVGSGGGGYVRKPVYNSGPARRDRQ